MYNVFSGPLPTPIGTPPFILLQEQCYIPPLHQSFVPVICDFHIWSKFVKKINYKLDGMLLTRWPDPDRSSVSAGISGGIWWVCKARLFDPQVTRYGPT